MKKLVATILTFLMVLTAFTAVYASNEIKVLLNDEEISFTDENGNAVYPQLINNRTMVPMRKIFEVLDMNVSWNGETQTVTATNDEKTIILTIGSEVAIVETSGEKVNITLDSVPVIVNARTLVPVRFIAESLGINVGWDGETQSVIMLDTSFIIENIKEKAPTFYEMLTLDREALNTFDIDIDANATLNYTDSSNKSNNNNLKLVIDGNEKKSENAISLNLSSKITGKGDIYDEIKELGYNNITLKTILDFDNLKVYIKSSLLKEMVGSKWAATILNVENKQYLDAVLASQETDLEALVAGAFSNIEVTKETYSNISAITEMVCKFLSDDFLKVSGRNTKTYEYKITLKDILSIILVDDEEYKEMINDMYEVEIKSVSKLDEDNMPRESSLSIKGSVNSLSEKIELKLNVTSEVNSLNKKITIEMPKDSEVKAIDE